MIRLQFVIALIIGGFWGFLAFLRLVLQYLTDPSRGWSYNVRKQKPRCLESEDDWTHNKVTLENGITLHYVEAGPPKRPLMLFLHGFPELWFSWRNQLKYFKDKYRVVAVSMRGYGDSDKPNGVDAYKMDELIGDVRLVIKALGAKTCVLVAHDWGGLIAYKFAIEEPKMLSKLIILNAPHSGAFWKRLRSLKQFLMSSYIFLFQLPWLPEFILTRFDLGAIVQMMKQYNADHEEEQAYLYHFSQPGAFTGPINYYRAAMRNMDPTKPETRQINTPTLIIWGTDDIALTEELATMSAEYCTNVRVKKIADGNHFIQQHRPDDVNAFMNEFLKEK